EYLFMAVVGGTSVWGAIVGSGRILTLKDQIQNVLPKVIDTTANFELVVFGILMILVLQYARDGVWPIISSKWADISGQSKGRRAASAPPEAPALPQRQRPEAGKLVLEVDAARKEFGGLLAINDISYTLKAGEIMGLIAPNGAGKSTTFNLITGEQPATSGKISFLGHRRDKMPSREIAKL